MKKSLPQHHTYQRGFTLIETLIAILILALTIGALLTLTAGGFFSIRYAKNDIVATNLMQESLEYIRNDRDSTGLTSATTGMTWTQWVDTYRSNGCFDNGCVINPYASSVIERVRKCDQDNCPGDYIKYFSEIRAAGFDGQSFYGYSGNNIFDPGGNEQPYSTSFTRTIKMSESPTTDGLYNEVTITSTMRWMNGTNTKQATQSIVLAPWNLQ